MTIKIKEKKYIITLLGAFYQLFFYSTVELVSLKFLVLILKLRWLKKAVMFMVI